MKKKVKGYLLFILMVTLTVFLIGCGQEREVAVTQSPEENAEDYVYVPAFETLEMGENDWVKNVIFQNEALYYLSYKYDAARGTSAYRLCKRELREGALEEVLYQVGGNGKDESQEVLNAFAMLPENKIALVLSSDMQESKMWTLKVLDESGTEILVEDITETVCQGGGVVNILNCVCDGEGNLYLQGDEKIWIYDKDGSFLFELDSKANGIQAIGNGKDGTVYVLRLAGGGMELSSVDVNKKDYGISYQGLPEDICISGSAVVSGLTKDLLITTRSGLTEYDLENKTYTELLHWAESNISADEIGAVGKDSDGRVLVFLNGTNTPGGCQLCTLTKTLKSEVVTVQTLTFGTFGLSPDIESAIAAFNKEHSQYQILVVDYSENVDMMDESARREAIARLNTDIITGNAPDILNLRYVDYELYMNRGIIEDLYPYLENSSNLRKEELNAAVLNAYTVEGKLPCIPTSFSISTVVGKVSDVGGRSGWTTEELLEFADSKPEDTIIMGSISRNDVLKSCMRFDMSGYVDWTSGKCYFNSEEFKAVLEFANRFPKGYERNQSPRELIAEGKLLLMPVGLEQFNDMQYYSALYQDEIAYIGYPTADGSNGSSFIGYNMFGISAQSAHKEAAWEFLESFLLSTENLKFSSGFPTLNREYDKKLEEKMEKQYQKNSDGSLALDEEGNPIEISIGSSGMGDFQVDYYALTQEEADRWEKLIAETDKVNNSVEYSEIYVIIEEEAAAYFEGQKSVEEVMDLIQNRAQIYVSENMK